MTPEQEKHLQKIKDQFAELVDSKYRKGQISHGGDLWAKSGLLDMAIEEAIDQVTYLVTLKEQSKISARKGKQFIMVDVCGTLCYGECWTEMEVLLAEPRLDIIEKVNELFKKNFIVIYTARKDELLTATLEWLEKHEVQYHAISNRKLGADLYIDDKATRPEEL